VNIQCDCEHESSGIICGHRPGSCKGKPTRKVSLHGLRMNICDHCFEMLYVPIPLEEKLDFDWYIPIDGVPASPTDADLDELYGPIGATA
jgi:hypothetical protein